LDAARGGLASTGMPKRARLQCAAIASEDRVPVWHKGRDFGAIARYAPLRTVHRLESLAPR